MSEDTNYDRKIETAIPLDKKALQQTEKEYVFLTDKD